MVYNTKHKQFTFNIKVNKVPELIEGICLWFKLTIWFPATIYLKTLFIMFVPEKLFPTHHVNSLINQLKPWEKDIIPPNTHIDTKCNEKWSFFIFFEVLLWSVNRGRAQV